jgi:hypothetical protein
MALYTLESLVLRGVSVLCGGKALDLRLDASVEPVVPISAVGNSMYPLSDARPDNAQPVGGRTHPVPNQVEKPAIEGTGRSHGVGTLHRLTATTARWAASTVKAPATGLFADARPQTRWGTRSR